MSALAGAATAISTRSIAIADRWPRREAHRPGEMLGTGSRPYGRRLRPMYQRGVRFHRTMCDRGWDDQAGTRPRGDEDGDPRPRRARPRAPAPPRELAAARLRGDARVHRRAGEIGRAHV